MSSYITDSLFTKTNFTYINSAQLSGTPSSLPNDWLLINRSLFRQQPICLVKIYKTLI
jgi:hypothetical protein